MNIETGQFLRIQIPVRARALWLSPAWAVICGLVASQAFAWNGHDVVVAALALVIADGAWATVWWGVIGTDWQRLLTQWKALEVERPASTLALRGSPADRSQHGLARLRLWWQTTGREQAGTPIFSALFSIILAVLLSAVVGGPALLLTLAALALTQVALILQLYGRSTHWVHGFVAIGLAWTLGHAAFSEVTLLSALTAVIFSFTYAAVLDVAHTAAALRRWLLPQIVMALVLVLLQQPLAALAFGAVLIAQALLSTVMQGAAFARAAQFWLMAAMLIAALGIR